MDLVQYTTSSEINVSMKPFNSYPSEVAPNSIHVPRLTQIWILSSKTTGEIVFP